MLDAVKYDGSLQHDGLLAQWYVEMKQTGDLALMFSPKYQSIGSLYAYFQRDAELVFQVREGKIIRASWFEPVMSGAFMGLWFTKVCRSRVESIHWTKAVCLLAFQTYPVILSLTKQDNLIDIFQRFGHTLIGQVPRIWQGEPAYLFSLVKEEILNGQKRRRRPECQRSRDLAHESQ